MYYKQNQDLSFSKATNYKKLLYVSLTINVIFVALLLMAFTREDSIITKTKIIKEVVTEKDVVLNDSRL